MHGGDEARDFLLGTTSDWSHWEHLLDPRFERHGAYLIPHGAVEWPDHGPWWVPDLPAEAGPDAWHAEDALLVPLRAADGGVLGILSIDEPLVAPAARRRPARGPRRRRRPRRGGDRARPERRGEPAPPHGGRAPAAGLLAAERPRRRAGDVRRGLRRHPRRARLREGHALPARGAGRRARPDRHLRLAARGARRACPLRRSRSSRRCSIPPWSARAASCCARAEALALVPHGAARRLRVGHERTRAAGVVVALAAGRRCTTPTATSSAPSGPTTPPTTCCRPPSACRRCAPSPTRPAPRSSPRASSSDLRHLAEHDPLTGLRNRREFEPRMLDRLRSADGGALLVCDLDNFKRVNDSLGHEAGDEVLRRFADVLRRSTRGTDVPTRLGGEEFAVLLPGRRPRRGAGGGRAPAPRRARRVRRASRPRSRSPSASPRRRPSWPRPPISCAPPTAPSTRPSAWAATAWCRTTPRRSASSTTCATPAAPPTSSWRRPCSWPRPSTCATSALRATRRPSGACAS